MSKEPVRPAVWAVTIAVAFSYMGVGVVDPILPEISSALKASPGQTELLFSTYLFVSAALMFLLPGLPLALGARRPCSSAWLLSRPSRRRARYPGMSISSLDSAAVGE